MTRNDTKHALKTTVLVLGLMATASCFAWHGGGGDYHGGTYYHGGAYNDGNYYHGSGYSNDNTYHGGYYGAGWDTSGVYMGGAYAPSCQSVQVCNAVGQCWLQQSCD